MTRARMEATSRAAQHIISSELITMKEISDAHTIEDVTTPNNDILYRRRLHVGLDSKCQMSTVMVVDQ